MTKAELVEKLAASNQGTKNGAETFLNSLVNICQRALQAGEEVTLTGLGKFKVVRQAARTGRNPQDGALIAIPARKKVKFLAHKALKEAVGR